MADCLGQDLGSRQEMEKKKKKDKDCPKQKLVQLTKKQKQKIHRIADTGFSWFDLG